ncbi:MAG: TetR/AcrR family transcriptional regulator [bacterium]|nr:TetR/AcrR family transcriptional regulator [bacterium]
MPRPATGRKKEAILDAAVVEIASHGYHGTTVAMIARRAGVADGTIYLYFRNKEEILVSLFDRAMDRFVEQGARELADLTEPAARLGRIIELHLELVGSDRDLAIITQVELRHSLHFLDQLSRAKVGAYLQAIAAIIAEGQAAGLWRTDLKATLLAKAVFGVLDEMATDWVLSRRNTRLQARAEAVAAFVTGALRPLP